jgi:ribosomal 30S subunit maturation factor RimM
MKCSNLGLKTPKQTFQYEHTFQMMKIISITHNDITNNEHLVNFHGIHRKNDVFKFQN